MQTAGSVIVLLTPDYRIMEWNQEAERVYGHPRNEVLEKDFVALFVPGDERDRVMANFQAVLAGDQVRDFETRIRRQDGTEGAVLWNINCLFDPPGSRWVLLGWVRISRSGNGPRPRA